ncbi:SusD/RagB family nutrient-binding outer membrane lipoprotein [Fulvivirga sp. M361]|uniref:SusD/RagB family nutrient-binding outer membrane lipoprotein n=1 Tax=Fulvivirga sp. M361 TaxID=2594266 RepID=UPI00117BC543|nr:SusD/RagB family nutrient-binding outer membrane lipoprotein [Fulvivirga sp. M361]TRX59916.1 SusD/RagB family nutrient-binding outer membrane lipoprotein [Fulvivirga sp. M361]
MKRIKSIRLITLIAVICLTSCESFDDLAINPNEPTQVNPSLILTNLEVRAFEKVDLNAALAVRYMTFTDNVTDFQYYGWQRFNFNEYDDLRQVQKMIEEAERIDAVNFIALSKFFRAYFYHELTQRYGDIPYGETLAGFEDNFEAEYIPQEEVYIGILKDLTEANEELDESNGVIDGDIVYGGNITQWKKLINSFHLRVLMNLSLKEGNTRFNVRSAFANIFNNPGDFPIFERNEDNAQLVFQDLDGSRYPEFQNRSLPTAYYFSSSFINMLKEREDPRLFKIAQPDVKSRQAANPGFETDFDSYSGLDAGAPLSENVAAVSDEGLGSLMAERYANDPVNEPGIALGYAEVSFILAEAVSRGWINGNAAEFYEDGIRTSMEFYDIPETDIEAYLQHPQVIYDAGQGLEMIITQKYISFFMNSQLEPFYNQRRTGFPTFRVGPATLNGGEIPKRWMYPEQELDFNQVNVNTAIQRQFSGNDNINGVMWLLQEE